MQGINFSYLKLYFGSFKHARFKEGCELYQVLAAILSCSRKGTPTLQRYERTTALLHVSIRAKALKIRMTLPATRPIRLSMHKIASEKCQNFTVYLLCTYSIKCSPKLRGMKIRVKEQKTNLFAISMGRQLDPF